MTLFDWDLFECETCKQRFALEQRPNDEVEEPICPNCGDTFCEHLGKAEVSRKAK